MRIFVICYMASFSPSINVNVVNAHKQYALYREFFCQLNVNFTEKIILVSNFERELTLQSLCVHAGTKLGEIKFEVTHTNISLLSSPKGTGEGYPENGPPVPPRRLTYIHPVFTYICNH